MFCSKCGNKLEDSANFCVNCGFGVIKNENKPNVRKLLNVLSERLNTNGIIWLVIGILQILGGIFANWFLLIIGALNIISAVQDMQYSKEMLEKPNGIVTKFEPLTGPIITLIYNLVIGGVIGVVGSIYYFVAIRNYVMENKQFFASLDAENN